jgi:hypothetical protein
MTQSSSPDALFSARCNTLYLRRTVRSQARQPSCSSWGRPCRRRSSRDVTCRQTTVPKGKSKARMRSTTTIETRRNMRCYNVLKTEMRKMSEPEWYLFSLCVTRRCVRRLVCCLPPPPPPLPLPPSFPPLPAKHHNTMNTPPVRVLIKHLVTWECR